MDNNNTKKRSLFSYLLMFLVIGSLIVFLITALTSKSGRGFIFNEGEIVGNLIGIDPNDPDADEEKAKKSVLWTEDIKSVTVSYYNGFIDLYGKIQLPNDKGTESIYNFKARITDT